MKTSTATTPTPRDEATSIAGSVQRNRTILVLLALILALSLGACTRDRAATEGEATGDVEIIAPGLGAAPTATPQPMNASGEPDVVASTPSPDEEGAEGGTTASTEETIVDYEVQPGDTLLCIAIKFDTSVERLKEMNFLATEMLQAGQPLDVPMIPPTPTPTPEPFYHVVQVGDSLTGIAAQYGVDWDDILTANRMADANALRAGDELIIPGYAPAGVPETETGGETGSESTVVDDGTGPATHTVQAGESLNGIAVTYGISASALADANGITNRNTLRVGQVLTIPGMTRQQLADLRAQRHVVASGESLSEIARQYGVTTQAIIDRNKLGNPNAIYVGQELIIPAPGE